MGTLSWRDRLIFTGTILWGLAVALLLTFLISIPLFHLEIGWNQLDAVKGLSAGQLQQNYNHLMNYLLNPFLTHLNFPDFRSSGSGLEHFSEVKSMFLLVIGLFFLLLPSLVLFLREHLPLLFHRALAVVLIIPLFFGITAVLLGFNDFFILFHELLFRNQDWVFNPATDPIINALPENFFAHCFIAFGLLYYLIFGWLFWLGRLLKNERL